MHREAPEAASSPRLPTAHQLDAALAAGSIQSSETPLPPDHLRLAYSRLGTDGIYSIRDLSIGEAILRAAGLLDCADGNRSVLSPEYARIAALPEELARADLLARYLALQEPLWFAGALADDRVAWELVPDDAARALETIEPDIERREALLLAAARRVDPDRDKRTGDVAEEYVASTCRVELRSRGRPDLAEKVQRVSLVSDQLGYDITAPRLDASARRIEVKGTRAQGPGFMIVLSRGEARQALRDRDWFLVACRVASDESVSLLGWCTRAEIEPFLPLDQDSRGQWKNVEIALDESMLVPGLPPC